MIGALIAVVLLAGTAQPQNPETADGFYCFTSEYFAYETLLHDSPQPHLLHVISLVNPSADQTEKLFDLPCSRVRHPLRRIECRDSYR